MRKKVEVVFFGQAKDFTKSDSINYWQKQSDEARLRAVWELTVDAWKLKGKDLNELRFQRTVGLFKSRKS